MRLIDVYKITRESEKNARFWILQYGLYGRYEGIS